MMSQQNQDFKARGIAHSLKNHNAKRPAKIMLLVICLIFVVLLIWSAIAKVDNITRAMGQVIPSSKLQIIQNLEGGIVNAIHVKQGDVVEEGALLISLSPIQSSAEFGSRKQQVFGLAVRAARLEAESKGRKLSYDAALNQQAKDIVAVDKAEYQSRQASLQAELMVIDSQIQQKLQESVAAEVEWEASKTGLQNAKEELEIITALVERGLEPRLELVRLNSRVSELKARQDLAKVSMMRLKSAEREVKDRREAALRNFQAQSASELTRTKTELNAQQELLPSFEDRLLRTYVRAPARGVVNRIFITTPGGVLKPSEPLLELVPAEDKLVIEARIRPQDIAFVRIGQPARIKLTAYDYTVFGAMDGQVTQISADVVPVDREESFYLARVEIEKQMIENLGKKLPIIPGMQAQVDIVTGNKTVLDYLTKPIKALKENAFRER
jgi:adhesin transport system membrane fusion protein